MTGKSGFSQENNVLHPGTRPDQSQGIRGHRMQNRCKSSRGGQGGWQGTYIIFSVLCSLSKSANFAQRLKINASLVAEWSRIWFQKKVIQAFWTILGKRIHHHIAPRKFVKIPVRPQNRPEAFRYRPHSKLGNLSPSRFAAQRAPSPTSVGLRPPFVGDGQTRTHDLLSITGSD